MYSKDIVVNCPHCLADIEISRMERTAGCPFCGKVFNSEDGIKMREIVLKKNSALSEGSGKEPANNTVVNDQVSERVKYCGECGRKLYYDARYCDWCGSKL